MARVRSKLDLVLDFMSRAERLRFLRQYSFLMQLEGKHSQNSAGQYTGFGDWLEFRYRVPQRVCSHDGHFSLSTLLAIMDETTTWASIGVDPHRRPGSSIALSGTLLRPVPLKVGRENGHLHRNKEH